MSWSRFDDKYAQHPKMVALGDFYEVGLALDVAGIGYCCLNNTDGEVPKAQIERLVRCNGMKIGATKVTPALVVSKLVAVGRWTDEGDIYRIHDFLQYNPSRAQVEEQRKATAERVQRHRNGRRNGVTDAVVTDEKRDCTPPPVPVPVPVPVPTGETHTGARESDPAPEPPKGSVVGSWRPIPADFELTDGRRSIFVAHKCQDPPLCFKAFFTHYDGLRTDRQRGWHPNWDSQLLKWCLNHEAYKSPCHKGVGGRGGHPQPDGPRYKDLSHVGRGDA